MSPISVLITDNENLAVRAAWLHYVGGYTQSSVAQKLGVSNLKAHRLITRANNEGIVKVRIDGKLSECVALENKLAKTYALDYCEVTPDLDEGELPLKALASAGAQHLQRLLKNKAVNTIGIGHGRTLAACVNQLPNTPAIDKTVVSLLGGFTRKFAANPHDVIHRISERTGANAFVMPAPFIATTLEHKKVILEQFGISEVLELACNSSVKIVGIGSVDEQASTVANAMVEPAEMKAVQRAGGVGEVLGYFFNDKGEILQTDLSDRTIGLNVNDMSSSSLCAVAGGVSKVNAIRAILHSHLLSGLITDERTARTIIDFTGSKL